MLVRVEMENMARLATKIRSLSVMHIKGYVRIMKYEIEYRNT